VSALALTLSHEWEQRTLLSKGGGATRIAIGKEVSKPSGDDDRLLSDGGGVNNCICPVTTLASQFDPVRASLEGAFESAAVGMALLDLDGRWLRVNHAFLDFLGLTKEELLHETFLTITHPDDVSLSAERYRSLAAGKINSYNLEKRYTHRSGHAVWAFLTVSLVRATDGAPAFVTGQVQDITKRRDAEEALRKSEALFRSIGENVGDLIVVVDFPNLNTMYASPTYETLLGHPIDEIKGHSCLEILHADDHERVRQAAREMATQGKNSSIFDIRIRSKGGEWHYIETHACAVRNVSGEIEQFVAVSRLIDDQLHARQQLQDREEQLQLLLDSTAEAIYGLDREGRCTFCNAACLKLLEYEGLSAVLGKDLHTLIHHSRPDGAVFPANERHNLRALMRGERTHVENDVIWRRDGSSLPVESWSYPVRRNGELVGCVVTFVDISERILAQEALRSANEQSALFINSVPSILVGMDTHGRITRWNFAAADAFGLSESEVVGRQLAQCGIHWRSPDMQREVQNWCKQRERRRYDGISFEKNGETRLLGVTVNWTDSPTEFGGELLIVGSDITEKRMLEEQLRQAQKLEAIGQLAAGIAHEINTPTQYVGDNTNFLKESWTVLAPLLAAARQLRQDAGSGPVPPASLEDFDNCVATADLGYLQEEIPRAIDQSLDGIQRVSKIVRAMKEFSHPGNEEKCELDINKAIETTLTVARNEWKYVAEIKTKFAPDLPLVPCHAGEFNQVVLNLVINAAHAVAKALGDPPHGKGTITVSTEHDGAGVRISLQDTGTGISEDIRSRVFDPFFTTKPVGQGTGQGLAMAHSAIVRRHGGKIWFETETGKGTTFFIWLPLAAATAE
jgi:PAS domain S-box-containing protein